jgi:hypothetical protein
VIKRYLLPEFGAMRMIEILPSHVRDFLRRLTEAGRSCDDRAAVQDGAEFDLHPSTGPAGERDRRTLDRDRAARMHRPAPHLQRTPPASRTRRVRTALQPASPSSGTMPATTTTDLGGGAHRPRQGPAQARGSPRRLDQRVQTRGVDRQKRPGQQPESSIRTRHGRREPGRRRQWDAARQDQARVRQDCSFRESGGAVGYMCHVPYGAKASHV